MRIEPFRGNVAAILRLAVSWTLAVCVTLSVGCHSGGHGHGLPAGRKPAATSVGAPHAPRPADAKEAEEEKDLDRRAEAYAAFAAGLIHQLNDDNDAAFEFFVRSVEQDLGNEALVVEVARRHLQQKQYDKALTLLRRAVQVENPSAAVYSFLGLTLAQLGRPDEAVAVYRESLRRMPGQFPTRLVLAQLLVEQKRAGEALQVLVELEGIGSADPRFWVDLAELYVQLGQIAPDVRAEAREHAKTAVAAAESRNPQDPAVLQRLADRQSDLGNVAAAEIIYRKLRDSRPRDPLPVAKLAELYLRTGKLKEGREQLETLHRENPANPIPLYYIGLLAAEQRDYTNAVASFRQTIQLNGNFDAAYPDLAGALLAIEKPEEALQVLEDARQRFKSSFRIEFLSGLASAKLKKLPDVNRYFSAALAVAGTNQPGLVDHRFYFQWGAALERGGDHSNAAVHLEKAIALKPDFADAMNHLGYMWAERGENLDRAHQLIRRAVELEPDNDAFLDSLAWVLFQLRRPAEALPWMEKAIQKTDSPDPTLYDHLGDILAALGRSKEAKDAWKKSLDIEDNPAIRKKWAETK